MKNVVEKLIELKLSKHNNTEIGEILGLSETGTRRFINQLKEHYPKEYEYLKNISYQNNPAISKRKKEEKLIEMFMTKFSLSKEATVKILQEKNIVLSINAIEKTDEDLHNLTTKSAYNISDSALEYIANYMIEKRLTIDDLNEQFKGNNIDENYFYLAINKILKRKNENLYNQVQEMIQKKMDTWFEQYQTFLGYSGEEKERIDCVKEATIKYGLSTRKMVKNYNLEVSHTTIHNDRQKILQSSSEILKKRTTEVINVNTPDSIKKNEVKKRVLLSFELFKQGFTIEEISTKMNVSYDVIYRDLTHRLERISTEDSILVKEILKQNKLNNLKQNTLQKKEK